MSPSLCTGKTLSTTLMIAVLFLGNGSPIGYWPRKEGAYPLSAQYQTQDPGEDPRAREALAFLAGWYSKAVLVGKASESPTISKAIQFFLNLLKVRTDHTVPYFLGDAQARSTAPWFPLASSVLREHEVSADETQQATEWKVAVCQQMADEFPKTLPQRCVQRDELTKDNGSLRIIKVTLNCGVTLSCTWLCISTKHEGPSFSVRHGPWTLCELCFDKDPVPDACFKDKYVQRKHTASDHEQTARLM